LLNEFNCSDSNVRYDDYLFPKKLANIVSHSSINDFFLVHFNVRSLSKNKEKVEEFISDFVRLPDTIAISETKLNDRNVINTSIPNYNFLRKDSLTNAGGVGLYIKQTFKYCVRDDLCLNVPSCEDLWIEIKTKQPNKTFVLAVIYRHPSTNFLSFQNKFCDTLLSLENQKISYVICGDININCLDTKSTKIKDYINSLSSVGTKSLINIPTRFSDNSKPSLLDHIYTNTINRISKFGVCMYDISDHLPTFFILKKHKFSIKTDTKFTRCTKTFNIEEFLIDLHLQLSTIDFDSTIACVNNDAQQLLKIFKLVLDKHAPLRPMTRKEKRLNKKPWITKGIFKSIKTKNRLFRSYFKSNDPEKKYFYKKYLNKLTHLKNLSKRLYYENKIRNSRHDSSKTWSIINEIIDFKNSSYKSKLPSTIVHDNQTYNTSSPKFLNKLCEFFAKIM